MDLGGRKRHSDNDIGRPGVYGTLGTPAASNIPGGRDSAVTWTDSDGNLWLFGGEGADANGNFGQLNDLWKFQTSTQQWTWTGGNNTVPASCAGSTTIPCGQSGVYGTLGSPAARNIPGGRDGAAAWADSSGNFWLFGGFGFDADGSLGELNDLWEFNPTTKEWAWMGGKTTIGSNGGQSGIYGTQGTPSTANMPGGRDAAMTWVDENGNLWLFGGEGFDAQGNHFQLNDLWEFSPSTGEWTWVNGGSSVPSSCSADPYGVCGQTVVYGQLGMPSLAANPGARVSASAWTDSEGDLWLFGGLGVVLRVSGAAMAFLLFFSVPRERRSWLAILLVIVSSVCLTSCGGGTKSGGGSGTGSGGQGGDVNSGTTPGNYTITVTGTSGNITVKAGTLNLTVQ